ncbi:MAG: spermidine synthase, partial [Selenomonadaceae bacterium]|nr:spermidine synthase [Selenomonadaceae bacterium]
MQLWFSEQHTPNVRFSLKVDSQLFGETSEFQRVDIFDSTEFGRILVLDGRIMLTERDEFIYHEMITHVPLCVNPDVRKVLLVGGGDGGSARELLKYDTIEKIDLVEIDETVVRACQKFIPQTAACLDNPRV